MKVECEKKTEEAAHEERNHKKCISKFFAFFKSFLIQLENVFHCCKNLKEQTSWSTLIQCTPAIRIFINSKKVSFLCVPINRSVQQVVSKINQNRLPQTQPSLCGNSGKAFYTQTRNTPGPDPTNALDRTQGLNLVKRLPVTFGTNQKELETALSSVA